MDSAPDRTARSRALRYVRLTAGWTLLVAGVGLLPLPGPGTALVLLGLAVLGPEVAWARRLRERLLARLRRRRLPVAAAVPVRDGGRGP
jgi:hypothetical protein